MSSLVQFLDGKTLLVTGASGVLGTQLIHDLNEQEVQPVCHSRETSDRRFIEALGFESRLADLRNRDQLVRMVDGIDIIIHTAAKVDYRGDRLTEFTGVNTMGTLDLFRAAQAAGVQRFVHVSTVAAIGGRPRIKIIDPEKLIHGLPRLNESSTFNLAHLKIPYIMTKRAAEVELLKAVSEGSTELVIVNPSIIVAPSRHRDSRQAALRRFFKSFIMPDIPNIVNLVDVRDVTCGIFSALVHGRHRERYILAGDNLSGRDLLLSASAILGKIPHLMRFPTALYRSAARLSMWKNLLLGRHRLKFYPDLVRLLDYDWAFSSRKAFEELDYRFRCIHHSLEDLFTSSLNGAYSKTVSR